MCPLATPSESLESEKRGIGNIRSQLLERNRKGLTEQRGERDRHLESKKSRLSSIQVSWLLECDIMPMNPPGDRPRGGDTARY